jgi:hypothetical protein
MIMMLRIMLTSTHIDVCWVPERVSLLLERPIVGVETL